MGLPSATGGVDVSANVGGGPSVEVKKPKSGFHVELPQLGFGGKSKGDAKTPSGSADASLHLGGPQLSGDAGLKAGGGAEVDVGKSKPPFHVELPKIGGHVKGPKADVHAGGDLPSGGVSLKGPSVSAAGSGDLGATIDARSPSGEIDDRAVLSDKKEGSLGRKMKGLFSVKTDGGKGKRKSGDVGLDADASIAVASPEVHIDRPHVEGGFATSYDAGGKRPDAGASGGLSVKGGSHNERAVDVTPPGGRVEGGLDLSGSASGESHGDAKGSKSFGVKIGVGKGSKEKKPKPRIEEGLMSSLATAGMAGGSVQMTQGLEAAATSPTHESHHSLTRGKKPSTSNI
jgi:hypothetical protein